MSSEAAALLDQLMGSTRNAVPGDETKELRWSDPEVCKNLLCGFCPSELFTNTKSDIGPCSKIHDERLKKAYEECEQRGKQGYEEKFLEYLESLTRDLDRKISRGKERLKKSHEAKVESMEKDGVLLSDKLKFLSTEIDSLVAELERLGGIGEIAEAQTLMLKMESLEKEREKERIRLTRGDTKMLAGFELDSHDFHEKMELCDICGSFLVIGDTQSRVDSHLLGKQHIGFARIRGAISELKKLCEEHRQERIIQRSKFKEERRQLRERSPEKRRSSRYRSRSRSRDRHRRHSHRSRSRSPERRKSERERGRKEQRKSRSRSRDRGRRNRSRSRGRDRERNRKDRSRSREKERDRRDRSRSREKDRKRRDRSRSKDRDRDRRDRSRSRDRERSRRDRSKSRDRDRDRRERSRSRDRDRRQRDRSRSKDRRSRSREREEREEQRDEGGPKNGERSEESEPSTGREASDQNEDGK